jgi:F5/8 type C domain
LLNPFERARRVARFALLVGLSGCSPDFSELSRGQTAVDSVAAGSAGMGSTIANAGAGDDGGAATSGAPGTHGGATGGAGKPSSGGATSSAGTGTSATGGEASGGDGGTTADAGSAGLNQGGDAVGGGSGAGNMPLAPSASASTEEFGNGNLAGNAFDGSSITKWCASDGSAPQWWQLDLQVMTAFSGVSIEFESPEAYPLQLQVSSDGSLFSVVLDQTANTNASQLQDVAVAAHGRYVRVYFPSVPPADPWPHWACLREFSLLDAMSDPTDSSAGPASGGGAGDG